MATPAPTDVPWIQISAIGEPVTMGSRQLKSVKGTFCATCKRTRVVMVAKHEGKVRRWWKAMRTAALGVVGPRRVEPLDGPLECDVTFYLERKHGTDHERDYPHMKPDLDKLMRAVGDALTKCVYVDDSRIVDLHIRKRWATVAPGATVRVRPKPRKQLTLV